MLIIVKKSSPTVYRSTGHTGRLICISITGILGCPRRATGVPLAKGLMYHRRNPEKAPGTSCTGITTTRPRAEREADSFSMGQPGRKRSF